MAARVADVAVKASVAGVVVDCASVVGVAGVVVERVLLAQRQKAASRSRSRSPTRLVRAQMWWRAEIPHGRGRTEAARPTLPKRSVEGITLLLNLFTHCITTLLVMKYD